MKKGSAGRVVADSLRKAVGRDKHLLEGDSPLVEGWIPQTHGSKHNPSPLQLFFSMFVAWTCLYFNHNRLTKKDYNADEGRFDPA